MVKFGLYALTATLPFCTPLQAEVPQVATDIAPVHSLVTQVMEGLGEPKLVLQPGASPHAYSLRPSEARALAQADVVFWVGEALTPWMEDSIETLATKAEVVELLAEPETMARPFRNSAIFGLEGHDEPDGHEDHDDAAHAEEAHEAHDEMDGHDDHDHAGLDPHAWLDPENAIAWTRIIATRLAEVDPENAAQYAANAEAATARLEQLTADVSARLAPVHGLRFVVFHDAYQYFEARFDMPALGAVSLGDATDPGAARMVEIRNLVREQDVRCIATEPQFNPALVETLENDAGLSSTTLDPLGAALEPGADFYAELISGLADSLLECQ